MTDSPLVFAYNSFLIFMTTMIVFMFRKRNLIRFIVYGIWFVLGLTNGILLSNRVTPLTGPDFKNLEEAAGVIKKYFTGTELAMFVILIIIMLAAFVIFIFRCPKYKGNMLRLRIATAVILAASV